MLPIRSNSKSKEDDDDFYSSMEPNPFFYIPETVNDIEPSKIPNDGFEFLQLVKQERDVCPDAAVPFPKKDIKVNSKKYYVPSNQERKIMHDVFFNCRNRIKPAQLKQKYCLKVGEQLPMKNDMLSWCAFCLGREAMLQMAEIRQDCLKLKGEYNFDPNGYEPHSHFVMSMDNSDHAKVLSYTNLWLKHLGFSHRLGLWIYALLLVVERPLVQNTADVLSFLAGTCVSIRPNLKNDDDILTIYTIITAISAYFGCKAKKLVSNTIAKSNSTKNIKAKTSDTSSEESGSSSESENMDD